MSTTKRSRSGSKSSKRKPASSYKRPGKIVKVDWEDAWSSSGWREPPPTGTGGCPCISVGYVIRHNRKGILLAGSIAADEDVNVGHAGRHGFIPKGMIRKIKVLE